MKPKLIVPIVVLLAGLGGGYKFAFAKSEPEPKPHVEGTVYILGKEFLVNLADGRFAKLTVGLLLDPEDHSTAPAESGGHGAAPKPPEGFGPMLQEGIVRDLITGELTNAEDSDLIEHEGREKLKHKILKRIKKHTDVHADEILFTDVTVQ